MDHVVAVLALDHRVQPWRGAYLFDVAGADLHVGAGQTALHNVGGILLETQLGDLLQKGVIDGQADLVGPLLQNFRNCIVSVRVVHNFDRLIFDFFKDLQLLRVQFRAGNQNFDHAQAVPVNAELVEPLKDFREYKKFLARTLAFQHLLDDVRAVLVHGEPKNLAFQISI